MGENVRGDKEKELSSSGSALAAVLPHLLLLLLLRTMARTGGGWPARLSTPLGSIRYHSGKGQVRRHADKNTLAGRHDRLLADTSDL